MIATIARPRETWASWFPDSEDDPGTIDELLETLSSFGVNNVSADNIRYWQKAGIIPAPTKRWHGGATRALYPPTLAALVIMELIALKDHGYSLQQIAPRVRAYALFMRNPDPLGIQEAITAVAREYEVISKRPISSIQIRFIDADGRDQTYHYDIPPDGTPSTQR